MNKKEDIEKANKAKKQLDATLETCLTEGLRNIPHVRMQNYVSEVVDLRNLVDNLSINGCRLYLQYSLLTDRLVLAKYIADIIAAGKAIQDTLLQEKLQEYVKKLQGVKSNM